ncbi:hypothetical protein PsYK624_075370 [Phanerochaete sordida]|uniref:F-box domain-containing protein n=1 Tax=Phanerochaete sordida TaxID=48140 RepID=A0A9P3G8U5_9APHY|nr:hypothetical protein PsYK624_075370 [Phanerochaete sordida]
MPYVPGELLDHVLQYLDDDKRSLCACSRVSRDIWLPFASQRLFHSVRFHAVVVGFYTHTGYVTFSDLLRFLATCERATQFIRNLVLDGSWRPRPTPNGTPPVFICPLGVDILSGIVAALPSLRTLELRDVELAMPSLMFRMSDLPPFKLEQLTLNYTQVHPLSPPCQRPGFDIPSILPMFSLGTLQVGYGPSRDPSAHPASQIGSLGPAGRATPISHLDVRVTLPDDLDRLSEAIALTAAPACLQSLGLWMIEPQTSADTLASIYALLACPASQGLQTLRINWGYGVYRDQSWEQLLPPLFAPPPLSSVVFTQDLGSQLDLHVFTRTFHASISVLHATSPPTRPTLASRPRKVRLSFLASAKMCAGDAGCRVALLPWASLDALAAAFERPAGHASAPEDWGIEVHVVFAREELSEDVFARMQNTIYGAVREAETRKLLRITWSRGVGRVDVVRPGIVHGDSLLGTVS